MASYPGLSGTGIGSRFGMTGGAVQNPRRNPMRRRPNRGTNNPGGMPIQNVSTNFLPNTPEYTAVQRGAEDQLANSLAGLAYQRAQVPGAINMFNARQGTNIARDTNDINENTAGRGVYDSTIRPDLIMRDVTTPYSRAQQDFQLQMEDLLNQLSMQEGEAKLGYNQSLMEAMLNRGQQVAEEMPLGLPGQYPSGPRRPRRRPRRNGGGRR